MATTEKYRNALERILRAAGDHGMSAHNRLGLIEYLAHTALGTRDDRKCKVCFQCIETGDYCETHEPSSNTGGLTP